MIKHRRILAVEPEIEPERVEGASDRSVGLVFAGVFVIFGTWPLLDQHPPRVWLLLLACAIGLVAICAPRFLRPLNVVWTRLGTLLHHFITPFVMGVVFFLVVTPTAWFVRASGKDPLRLKRDRDANTYWIERHPPGPDPRTMTRQF